MAKWMAYMRYVYKLKLYSIITLSSTIEQHTVGQYVTHTKGI